MNQTNQTELDEIKIISECLAVLDKCMRDYVVMRRDKDVSHLAAELFITRIEILYMTHFAFPSD